MPKPKSPVKPLKILNDLSEQLRYNNPALPIYVRPGSLNQFPQYSAQCHWHEDVEFLMPVKGHLSYHINGKDVLIGPDEVIFVNAGHLHYGYSTDGTNCEYFCIVFHPKVITENKWLTEQYITPVTENFKCTDFLFQTGLSSTERMRHLLSKIYCLYQNRTTSHELMGIQILMDIWMELYQLIGKKEMTSDAAPDKDQTAQKEMMRFIYSNYTRKISLNDIAASGGVSRTKCCQMFQKYLHRSPIEFLNVYRLQLSMEMLSETTDSITEIAYACGFETPSYYAETFKKYKGCTPREFRTDTP